MNHYPIAIAPSSDIGALNGDGQRALAIGLGATAGLVVGKGKLIPLALGAGLGYLVSNMSWFQKLAGQ